MTVTEAQSAADPERRPNRCEEHHQADRFWSEQLHGTLSRRKSSGVSGTLTDASFAWLRHSMMTDEVAATTNPRKPLFDRV
jgi:hypothetical protein